LNVFLQALQNDIETLTATYTLLSATGKELTHELEGGLLQVVKARMFKLNSHWSETLKKAGEQNVLLKDAYEKTKQVGLELFHTPVSPIKVLFVIG